VPSASIIAKVDGVTRIWLEMSPDVVSWAMMDSAICAERAMDQFPKT